MIRWDYIFPTPLHKHKNININSSWRGISNRTHINKKIININKFNHKIPSTMRDQNNSLCFSNKRLRWQARPIFMKPRARSNSRLSCGVSNRLLRTVSLTHRHKRNRSLSDQTNIKRLDIIHQISWDRIHFLITTNMPRSITQCNCSCMISPSNGERLCELIKEENGSESCCLNW